MPAGSMNGETSVSHSSPSFIKRRQQSRYVCPCIARKGCECGRVHTSSGDWSALVSAGTVSPSNEERNRETPCAERVLVRGSSASNPCSALTRRCGPLSPSRDRAHRSGEHTSELQSLRH